MDDSRHRAEFYRMWEVAHGAGFIHPIALEQMGPRERPEIEGLRSYLLDGVRHGLSIGGMVRIKPDRFEPFEGALLSLADASGTFDQSLRLLGDYYHAKYSAMLTVKKEMTYPLFLALVVIFIGPLPLVFYGSPSRYLAAVTAGLVTWFAFGGAWLDWMTRRFHARPAFVRARLARTLATALEAGLGVGESVRFAVAAAADRALTAHMARFAPAQLDSYPLAKLFAGAPSVPPDFLGAMHVADVTSDYSTTLRKVADLYEDGFK
ncbi:MAG: type II secretion system F family protein [Gemmatimonadaceae bacterium]|nr:type II secretion system F family protein [Gemmatimonadaceae bacterium]